MNNPDAMRHTLVDIIFMETVGMRPVVVHGGGPSINRAMEAAAIEPVWIKGRRVTDAKTLEIVEQTLGHELNQHLAEEIERLGGRAVNLNFRTTNVLFGKKLLLEEPGFGPNRSGIRWAGQPRGSSNHREPYLHGTDPRHPIDVHR
jgi:acetylglutamate kinase